MKPPRWTFQTKAEQSAIGINPCAVELLAESFATHRADWCDETLLLVAYGRDRQPVYIWLSSIPPEGAPPLVEQPAFFEMHVRLTERPDEPTAP